MPTFTAEGWVKLNGVRFTIEADTEEEARKKVEHGEWDEYDVSGAETTDWQLRKHTLREDK